MCVCVAGCSKLIYLQTAILCPRNTFANLSRNPRLSFAGSHVKDFLLHVLPTEITFANSEKKRAGSHVGTLAALAIKAPYMDLLNDS